MAKPPPALVQRPVLSSDLVQVDLEAEFHVLLGCLKLIVEVLLPCIVVLLDAAPDLGRELVEEAFAREVEQQGLRKTWVHVAFLVHILQI